MSACVRLTPESRLNMQRRRLRKITYETSVEVAKQAAQEISAWLKTFDETVSVRNVEAEPEFQKMDIDLLWQTTRDTYRVEIKADRWHRTGNFFFETHSNKEKHTPGCMLYTQADYIFYYFIETGVLYVLPVQKTQSWFRKNYKRFQERATTTPVGTASYTTVGRLVPIRTALKEIPGIKKVAIDKILSAPAPEPPARNSGVNPL